MIIGITGGTGCGKTTALQAVRELGGTVIDCDAVYHRLLEEDPALVREILTRFPAAEENGALNRKKLGKLVFSDPDSLKDLNAITHRAVRKEVIRLLTPCPELAAVDAFELFDSGLAKLCTVTVAVTAPTESRIRRLIAREGISREYALSRIQAQPSNETFSRKCSYTLCNDKASREEFYRECLAFFRGIIIMK